MKFILIILFSFQLFAQGYYYGGAVPSIQFITSTTTNLGRTGNGDLTATLPTGWGVGNVAVMIVWNDQGDASTPTNWTEITGSPFGSATPKLCVFVKTLWTGEPNPVTTISGSTTNIAHQAGILVYANVDTTTPISVIGTATAGTGTPNTAGAITTTSANQVVIGLCGRGDNEAYSGQTFGGSATGVAERMDVGTTAGNDAQVSAYDKTIATTSTSSGNGSATTSATDPYISVLIGLKLK